MLTVPVRLHSICVLIYMYIDPSFYFITFCFNTSGRVDSYCCCHTCLHGHACQASIAVAVPIFFVGTKVLCLHMCSLQVA